MKTWLGAFCLCAIVSASAWAQGAAPAPAPQPAANFAIRNPMIDAAIFVVLAGAAVFAVARTSQRV